MRMGWGDGGCGWMDDCIGVVERGEPRCILLGDGTARRLIECASRNTKAFLRCEIDRFCFGVSNVLLWCSGPFRRSPRCRIHASPAG